VERKVARDVIESKAGATPEAGRARSDCDDVGAGSGSDARPGSYASHDGQAATSPILTTSRTISTLLSRPGKETIPVEGRRGVLT
jgi:hypothetical protein